MRNRPNVGWAELVTGILLIMVGIFSFLRPGATLTGIVVIYGIMAIITGIKDIVLYVQVDRHTGFGPTVALVTGILNVMSGFMLLVYPGAGRWILTLICPIWFIAHCISRLSNLDYVRFTSGDFSYYFTLIVNIIGLVLGFMMIVRSYFSMLSASYIIGFYLILLGIDSLVEAFGRSNTKW